MYAFLSATPVALSPATSHPLQTLRGRRVSRTVRYRQPCRAPRATLGGVMDAQILVAASEVYAKVATGGIGIICSGLVGAIIVGFIVRGNYSALEERFMNREVGDDFFE